MYKKNKTHETVSFSFSLSQHLILGLIAPLVHSRIINAMHATFTINILQLDPQTSGLKSREMMAPDEIFTLTKCRAHPSCSASVWAFSQDLY